MRHVVRRGTPNPPPWWDALVSEWRAEAKLLRRRGAIGRAVAAESYAAEVEERSREYQLEALTLQQAAAESGFSYSTLEKMLRTGDLENVGRKRAPRVRRGDLPRKPRRCRNAPENDGIAALVLAGHIDPDDHVLPSHRPSRSV